MTCYEITSIVISIISTGAIVWLSFTANNIAKESLNVQKEGIISKVDKDKEDVKKNLINQNAEDIFELNKTDKELKKQKVVTYSQTTDKMKTAEYKKWKQKNEIAKKQFLKAKK